MKIRRSVSSRSQVPTWHDLVAILALCMLSIALYRKIALTNRILSGTDAMTYFYPYRAYSAQAISAGRVPLWNPHLFLGVPFLANPQTAVFYPLNLALSGLTAPKQVAWSLVVHGALASAFAYLYARRVLLLSPWAAFLAAVAFGQGGYLAAQSEHVNQVNVLAWFPLTLLLWEVRQRGRWLALLGLAATVGVGLLAGHTQASYISLVGLALYAIVTDVSSGAGTAWSRSLGWLRSLFEVGWQLALVVVVAFGLAAVQMLPTLELSRLSIRSGGLGYRQAVAFSLKPLPSLLRYTFLPRLWGQGGDLSVLFGGSYYTEYLAYIGYVALLLAFLACVLWLGAVVQGCRQGGGVRWSLLLSGVSLHEFRITLPFLVLGGAGLFLALGLYNPFYWLLYKLVPGFGLFRAPVRWLFLYAFASAMLAGIGLQSVQNALRRPQTHAASQRLPWRTAERSLLGSILPILLAALGITEILVAARHLPLNHPTAPESFSSLRTAPAHIRAAQTQETAPGRFLSMSDTLFDPGDLAEIERVYQDQLTPPVLYKHIVNVKRQEILAPNLPLAWRTYAVDGYDGGVLPLTRYVHLQRLLLDENTILTDGRIREGLAAIPPSRVLSILGAEYVLTDKTHDLWIDDVFYDLAFETTLTGDVNVTDQTQRTVQATSSSGSPLSIATALGIVSHLEGARQVTQGTPVAQIVLTMRNNKANAPHLLEQRTFNLLAGRDSAEGLYTQATTHTQARIGRQWQFGTATEVQTGYDYVTELSWGKPQEIIGVEINALPFKGRLSILGLSLVDHRDQSSVPLLLNSRGSFRQVHSGDVKIYQAIDSLPRAYTVYQARTLEDDAQAVSVMAEPTFDPSQTVLLHLPHQEDAPPVPALPDTSLPPSHVAVLAYKPEEIVLRADMNQPGYVVLSDTWYPGWQALLDGQPTPIERANLVFRAIHVPQGTHSLHLRYRPASYTWGLGLSLGTLTMLVLGSILSGRQAVQPAAPGSALRDPN